jgi:hypothetical protein
MKDLDKFQFTNRGYSPEKRQVLHIELQLLQRWQLLHQCAVKAGHATPHYARVYASEFQKSRYRIKKLTGEFPRFIERTCICAAYTFPHKQGKGKCEAKRGSLFCTGCFHVAEVYVGSVSGKLRSFCCDFDVTEDLACPIPVTDNKQEK